MICYVILHYRNINDTIKCIESLENTASKQSVFIVVDNGSKDGSIDKLKLIFRNNPNCEFCGLPNNLGFSKGNNYGYSFAKKKYNPEYIVIANNDVVFYQKDFEKNIEKIFARSKFFVLGPDIYVPRHKDHQSPIFKNGITIKELKKEIAEYRYYRDNPYKFIRRLKLHALKNMFCSKSVFINWLYGKIRGRERLNYRKEHENVGLQGSCLVFSKLFIENEEKAFDPEPFLYEEESFLFFRCQKKMYKMLYSPTIGIRHEEGASFNYGNNCNLGKIIYMLDCHIKSREELLFYLNNENIDQM